MKENLLKKQSKAKLIDMCLYLNIGIKKKQIPRHQLIDLLMKQSYKRLKNAL